MAKVTELLADIIIGSGITHAFGLPGGVTPFLFEELQKRPKQIKLVVARHEGSAAVMADVYGRVTRKPGLVMGQGLWMGTNGAFGIAEAYLAGSPMVIITEVSDWYGINQHGPYQLGSGEYGAVDLPNVYRAMTKYLTYAQTPQELVYGTQLAIKHATAGRPGPACVITRWNTMLDVIEEPAQADPPLFPTAGYLRVKPPSIAPSDARAIADLLVQAESPVMICGRGVHASRAYAEVEQLARLLGMPVATSYMGKGVIPETHDLAVGVMAALGQPVANEVIHHADVILAVGTCLAPDNTNNCSREFIDPARQKILHVDIDPRNAGWTYPVHFGVTADAKNALQAIISAVRARQPAIDVEGRVAALAALKLDPEFEFFTSKFSDSEDDPIAPEKLVKVINELMADEDLLVLDAGNNRMWFTKLFQTTRTEQLLAAGGAAGMAWGPSAALAAAMLHDDGRVISTVGDGGLLMALYVLETAKQFALPVKYVVFNNSSLGNVRDFLGRKGRACCEYDSVNFARIAEAMNVPAYRVESIATLKPTLAEAFDREGLCLVDVVTSQASHMRIKKG